MLFKLWQQGLPQMGMSNGGNTLLHLNVLDVLSSAVHSWKDKTLAALHIFSSSRAGNRLSQLLLLLLLLYLLVMLLL